MVDSCRLDPLSSVPAALTSASAAVTLEPFPKSTSDLHVSPAGLSQPVSTGSRNHNTSLMSVIWPRDSPTVPFSSARIVRVGGETCLPPNVDFASFPLFTPPTLLWLPYSRSHTMRGECESHSALVRAKRWSRELAQEKSSARRALLDPGPASSALLQLFVQELSFAY